MTADMTAPATKQDIALLVETMNAQFQTMNARFTAADRRFDEMDAQFYVQNERFQAIDERFDVMDERFDLIDERLDNAENTMFRMDEKIDRNHHMLLQKFDEHRLLFTTHATKIAQHDRRITALETKTA